MSEAELIAHASQALYLVLIVSMPPIAVAAGVGIFLALIQALTQIQEQTLQFAVKLIAVILVLWMTGEWLGGQILGYALQTYHDIGEIGKQPPR